jgi:DNA invertase Pin-like site-specific DNA recombinase
MRQEAECYQYAGQHGMAVSPEYVYYEEANTGEHWSDRPAYSALLLDAMRGKFSALIVSDRGVLESNPDTLEQLSTTLATNGVTLYSVH